MRKLIAALAVSATLGGCAGGPPRVPTAALPGETWSEPERYVVVTLRNLAAPLPSRAGSTPRGYDGAASYTVSAAALAAARSIATDYALSEVAQWPIASLRVYCLVYRLPAGQPRDALLARLATDPRIEIAQPLQTFSTSSVAYNDKYVGLQTGFAEMSVAAAHQWSDGAGVTVAIIDTGVDATHPDLAGRIHRARDFVSSQSRAFDRGRHGTEVAGVIAAVGNNGLGIVGVAPRVELLSLRACWQPEATRASAVCNTFTLAQALEAAIDARADVVNLSLVGPSDPLLEALTVRATENGSIVVGAVPSSGRLEGFPAGVRDVLAVDMAERPATSATLRAPGADVLTLTPGGAYDFASGSSLSAASVSGIVALLRARRHLATPEARRLLEESTRPLGTSADATRSINACAALSTLLATDGCPQGPRAGVGGTLHATR